MTCKRIINWDYDPKRDIIFIFTFPDYDYQESIELGNMVLDLNYWNKPVALEIMGASIFLGMKNKSLTRPQDFQIKISEKKNCLNVNGYFKFTSKEVLMDKNWRKDAQLENKVILKNILIPVYSPE